MALEIIWNNIINETCDVIVTPASPKAHIGSGLDAVIHKAAGAKLLAARKKLGPIGPGIVKVTDSYDLKRKPCGARHVIHALGPLFCGELDGTERPLLLGCYLQVLCTAASLGAKTVAMPVMSSGKFGMPMDLALDVAVEAIQLFLQTRPDMTVKLVGIDSDFREYALSRYRKFVIEKFDAVREEVYRTAHKRQRTSGDPDALDNLDALNPDEQPYFRKLRFDDAVKDRDFKGLFRLLWDRVQARDREERNGTSRAAGNQYFITSRKDLALCSGVTSRYIKRLVSNEREKCTPSKDVVLALAAAMRLSLDYTRALLKTCGEVLEKTGRDAVIADFIRTGGGRSFDLDVKLAERGFCELKTRSASSRRSCRSRSKGTGST